MKFSDLTKDDLTELCQLFKESSTKDTDNPIISVDWDGTCFVFSSATHKHYYQPPDEIVVEPGQIPKVNIQFVKSVSYGQTTLLKPSRIDLHGP